MIRKTIGFLCSSFMMIAAICLIWGIWAYLIIWFSRPISLLLTILFTIFIGKRLIKFIEYQF